MIDENLLPISFNYDYLVFANDNDFIDLPAGFLARKPMMLVAKKTSGRVWVMLPKEEDYRNPGSTAA